MPGKSEIIAQVADRTNMRKTEVSRVLDEALDAIRESLDRGESVTLRGFGSFRVTQRAARKGRNPRTGEPIEIPAGQRVVFRQSR